MDSCADAWWELCEPSLPIVSHDGIADELYGGIGALEPAHEQAQLDQQLLGPDEPVDDVRVVGEAVRGDQAGQQVRLCVVRDDVGAAVAATGGPPARRLMPARRYLTPCDGIHLQICTLGYNEFDFYSKMKNTDSLMGAKLKSKTHLPKTFFDFLSRFLRGWLQSYKKVLILQK